MTLPRLGFLLGLGVLILPATTFIAALDAAPPLDQQAAPAPNPALRGKMDAPAAGVIMRGPLRRHPANPRYFTDDSGQAIVLSGSHTWNNLVDMGPFDPPPRFDYEAYLDWLARYPHNFFRLWTWELITWNTSGNREKNAQVHRAFPHPWKRTGPGLAVDGKPKFNRKEFDEEYFGRLRQRVQAARERGIYAAYTATCSEAASGKETTRGTFEHAGGRWSARALFEKKLGEVVVHVRRSR